MEREEIIRQVARTLFLCAYADGVDSGEIAGEEARSGEDWDDVAPRAWRYTLTVTGEHGSVEYPNEEDGIVAAHAAVARRNPAATLRINRAFASTGLALAQWKGLNPGPTPGIVFHEVRLVRAERPDPDAEKEARRIVDAFDDKANDLRAEAAPGQVRRAPVVIASDAHARLSGGERFAHCLAMEALGHGVGLTDDIPSGMALPGWIRASVPTSCFGAEHLDATRYLPPAELPDSTPAEG